MAGPSTHADLRKSARVARRTERRISPLRKLLAHAMSRTPSRAAWCPDLPHTYSMSVRQFICTKWGSKYPSAEVNRLYRALQRVSDAPFTLYCLTDNPAGILPEVQVLP